MDGVLIDAKDWHYEALNKALSLFGMEISRYDHLITYDGLPTKEKLKMLTQEKNLPASLHSFINSIKQKYTQEIIFKECRPTFSHRYMLSKLQSANYKLAVCSNSIRETIETMLTKAAIHKYFEFCLSNEDVKKSKPDPEIYTKAIDRLQLTPSECLIVEDNINGIKAAKATGGHVLEINTFSDVNYHSIIQRIKELEN